jgi:hypothetical protein
MLVKCRIYLNDVKSTELSICDDVAINNEKFTDSKFNNVYDFLVSFLNSSLQFIDIHTLGKKYAVNKNMISRIEQIN